MPQVSGRTLARGDLELTEAFQARAAQLLIELHGAEPEDAVCAIRELPAEGLSVVADGYRRESDGSRRQVIIHALWESRNPAVLSTLSLALSDPDDRVWKEALDGIVTLGGSQARQILERARDALADQPELLERRTWVHEAIEQMQRAMSPG